LIVAESVLKQWKKAKPFRGFTAQFPLANWWYEHPFIEAERQSLGVLLEKIADDIQANNDNESSDGTGTLPSRDEVNNLRLLAKELKKG
jgi:hypothetical protein